MFRTDVDLYLFQNFDSFVYGRWKSSQRYAVVGNLQPYKLGSCVVQEVLQIFLPEGEVERDGFSQIFFS